MIRLSPIARAALTVAKDSGFVVAGPSYAATWKAVAELWVDGALKLTGHHRRGVAETATFRLTKEGDELARVVCAP